MIVNAHIWSRTEPRRGPWCAEAAPRAQAGPPRSRRRDRRRDAQAAAHAAGPRHEPRAQARRRPGPPCGARARRRRRRRRSRAQARRVTSGPSIALSPRTWRYKSAMALRGSQGRGHRSRRLHRQRDLPGAGGRGRRGAGARRRPGARRPRERAGAAFVEVDVADREALGPALDRRRPGRPHRRPRARVGRDGRLRSRQRGRHRERARRGRRGRRGPGRPPQLGGRLRVREPRPSRTRRRFAAPTGSPTSTPSRPPTGSPAGAARVVIRPGDVYGPGSVPWTLRPLEMARAGQLAVPGAATA